MTNEDQIPEVKIAIVIDGIIDKVVIAPENFTMEGVTCVPLDEGFWIGDFYEDGEFLKADVENP